MKMKFFATYREITRLKELDIPATTDVWALMAYLTERYGEPMRKKLYTPDGAGIGQDAIILVNGVNVAHLQNEATPLRENDAVAIFPMVAGG